MHVIRAGGATLQNPPVFVDRKAWERLTSVAWERAMKEPFKETERRNLPLTIPILHVMGNVNPRLINPRLIWSGYHFSSQ